MKRLIPFLLAVILILAAFSGCSAGASVTQQDAARTVTLGNAWTDVFPMGQSAVMDMEISNLSDSGRNVMVRVVSDDYKQILAFEMLVPCGEAVVFPPVPSGGCIIQAKSADDATGEFLLSYTSTAFTSSDANRAT